MLHPTCPDCGNRLPAIADDGSCPRCLLMLGAVTESPPIEQISNVTTPVDTPGSVVGAYTLLQVVGEGNFGVVWMAEQREPVRRRVALKILKLGMDTRAVIARFEAERQALALMDHPGIAHIYDGGTTASGRPFFVMELVRGQPFTEYCDVHRLNIRQRLELFTTVCDAVQHAHLKGVIHRDLKPSNILVQEVDGRPVPKVIDFGIAKATEQPLTEKTLWTHVHQFMGTPAYMSPEQVDRRGLDVDTRSDIYSLGVILFELVTGQPPFNARNLLKTGVETFQKTIREVEAPKASSCLAALDQHDCNRVADQRKEASETLIRRIRGELDWIILKALEKDRSRRYQSANALALDLLNHLTDQPVTAAPPSWRYQFTKLARRHRPALATAVAFSVVLVTATIISAWLAIRATHLSNSEKSAREREQLALLSASNSLVRARLNAYASEMKLAQQALAENNQSLALDLLNRQRPKDGEPDLRGFEWRYLWQLARPNQIVSFRDGFCQAVAYSPDGRFLAYGADDRLIIRQSEGNREVTNLPVNAQSLAFSPRQILAVAYGTSGSTTSEGVNGELSLWDTTTWQRLRNLPAAAAPVRFSPDGQWLATGSTNGPGEAPRITLWRTEDWQPVASAPATTEMSGQLRNAFTFSPDGKMLATPWMKTAEQKCGLNIWRIPSLELEQTFFGENLPVCSAAFLNDSTTLLIGTWLGELALWHLPSRSIVQVERENNSGITSVSTSPSAPIFATTSHDHRVSLWDSRTRKVLARFRGHTSSIWASALSPDGSFVATGSLDGMKLWDGNARDSSNLINHGPLIAGFAADNRTLILAPREGDLAWRLAGVTNAQIPVLGNPPLDWGTHYINRPYDVYADPPFGVLGSGDGSIQITALTTGMSLGRWQTGTNPISALSISPDGRWLATGHKKRVIKLWSIAERKEIATFSFPVHCSSDATVSKVVFSPDGKSLAATCWPGWPSGVVVWDLPSRSQIHEFNSQLGNHSTLAFSPDGRSLAAALMGPSDVYIWDLPSGKPHHPLKGHVTGIVQVAFAPDGRTLATGGYDTVKLWNVATEREVADFPQKAIFREFQFSRDGRTFAVGYYGHPGHFVRLYQAPTLGEIEALDAAIR